MSTVTVRLNEEEENIYRQYAEFKNVALSTLMKEALQEKIEDEMDLKSVLDYEQRLKDGEVQYFTSEETKKLLGL